MPNVNYKPANLRGLGSDFQLKPGINAVPAEIWDRWSKDPEILMLAGKGLIEVEVPAPAAKAAPPAPPKAEEAPAEDPAAELSDDELEKLAENAAK